MSRNPDGETLVGRRLRVVQGADGFDLRLRSSQRFVGPASIMAASSWSVSGLLVAYAVANPAFSLWHVVVELLLCMFLVVALPLDVAAEARRGSANPYLRSGVSVASSPGGTLGYRRGGAPRLIVDGREHDAHTLRVAVTVWHDGRSRADRFRVQLVAPDVAYEVDEGVDAESARRIAGQVSELLELPPPATRIVRFSPFDRIDDARRKWALFVGSVGTMECLLLGALHGVRWPLAMFLVTAWTARAALVRVLRPRAARHAQSLLADLGAQLDRERF